LRCCLNSQAVNLKFIIGSNAQRNEFEPTENALSNHVHLQRRQQDGKAAFVEFAH